MNEVNVPEYLRDLYEGASSNEKQQTKPTLLDPADVYERKNGRNVSLRQIIKDAAEVRDINLEVKEVMKRSAEIVEKKTQLIVILNEIANKPQLKDDTRIELEGNTSDKSMLTFQAEDGQLYDTIVGQAKKHYESEARYSDGSTMKFALSLLEDKDWEEFIDKEEAAKLKELSEHRNQEKKRQYALAFCAVVNQRATEKLARLERKDLSRKIQSKIGQTSRPFEDIGTRDNMMTDEVVRITKKAVNERLKTSGQEVTLLRNAESTLRTAIAKRNNGQTTRPLHVTEAEWQRSGGHFNQVVERYSAGTELPVGYSALKTDSDKKAALDKHRQETTHPVGSEFYDLKEATALLLDAKQSKNQPLEVAAIMYMRDAISKYEKRIIGMLRGKGMDAKMAGIIARILSEPYSAIIASNRTKSR